MNWTKHFYLLGCLLFTAPSFAQTSVQSLLDSMLLNHGKIKSATLKQESIQLKAKLSWGLPQTDFNLQQGQINASNWDYFFTISQSLDGIWQKKTLENWIGSKGKLNAVENQLFIRQLSLELKEFVWLYLQSISGKKIIEEQKAIISQWREQIISQTKTGYSSEWELWVVNHQFQKILQEENRINQQIQYLKKSIELYTQVELKDDIATWNLLEQPIQKELAKIFSEPLVALENQHQMELKNLRNQIIPTPYLGAFRQQLESIPGYVGFVTGVKVPFNYQYLQREKQLAKVDFQKDLAAYQQEFLDRRKSLEINLDQFNFEKTNESKLKMLSDNDQTGISNWIKNNQKVGNKSFLEQSQLYQTYWENQKMIQESKTRLGLLILQNQFLTQ